VTERFAAAATAGGLAAPRELLAPGVTLWTDGGGKATGIYLVISPDKLSRVARRPETAGTADR
jgi:hypothetical protein